MLQPVNEPAPKGDLPGSGSDSFTFTGVTVTMPKTEAPPLEKEVIRLPDGRELTYYRFPDIPPGAARAAPSEASGSRGSPIEKEH